MAEQRVDILLAEKQLVRSRTEAQKLIADGRVSVVLSGVAKTVAKPSEKFQPDSEFVLSFGEEQKYASRAGLKLAHALAHFKVNVSDTIALDVGQSTGGFSDCLLQQGCRHVIGIEVGHSQLVAHLRSDARITCLEGYNARNLQLSDLPAEAQSGIDLVVMDVSFISQHLILPKIPAVLKPKGTLVSLVKPQFEVGQQGLGKKGVVTDQTLYAAVEAKIRRHLEELGLACRGYIASPILGGDGNHEFLLLAQKM
ncbi:23S rRNA (cytidine1920-2'-O)/16S rRNA (cytidine1409-2'-O)-methyltransferase [Alteromonadaceae bacterium 2753L.S.0a.02]|nr:23S rRNA (cytidine1920-2'-O)/16S rRNA (cytidine1409-2'-O)-methyltransferase [Alteromonadaceae bacterium 2753L.S.0a.02]